MSDCMCSCHEPGDVKWDYVSMSQKLETANAELAKHVNCKFVQGTVDLALERIKGLELQLDEAKKALAQYVNVFLPGSICPANDLFQPGGMFHEPPKPWTQEQKEALRKVCDAFTRRVEEGR